MGEGLAQEHGAHAEGGGEAGLGGAADATHLHAGLQLAEELALVVGLGGAAGEDHDALLLCRRLAAVVVGVAVAAALAAVVRQANAAAGPARRCSVRGLGHGGGGRVAVTAVVSALVGAARAADVQQLVVGGVVIAVCVFLWVRGGGGQVVRGKC